MGNGADCVGLRGGRFGAVVQGPMLRRVCVTRLPYRYLGDVRSTPPGACSPDSQGVSLRVRARAEFLVDAECLALVMGRGGALARRRAESLLSSVGGIRRLADASAVELEEHGLASAQVVRLQAALGLARRLANARLPVGGRVRSAADVAALVWHSVHGSCQEQFFALLLNVRHRVLAMRRISIGSLTSAVVHPREVFRMVLREGAAAAVFAHNHPSGEPAPSEEDRTLTQRLIEAGQLIGVEVLDHLVVGEGRYFSFAEGRIGDFAPA